MFKMGNKTEARKAAQEAGLILIKNLFMNLLNIYLFKILKMNLFNLKD
jgi:hypothetical protein